MDYFSGDLDYFNFILLRPILAVAFTFSVIFFGWFLAWKLVLVHVPLVQEIFGLRKKTLKPKPPGRRRFTHFYNRLSSNLNQWYNKILAFTSVIFGGVIFKIITTP